MTFFSRCLKRSVYKLSLESCIDISGQTPAASVSITIIITQREEGMDVKNYLIGKTILLHL